MRSLTLIVLYWIHEATDTSCALLDTRGHRHKLCSPNTSVVTWMAEVEGQRQAVLAMYRWADISVPVLLDSIEVTVDTCTLESHRHSPPSLRDIKEGEQLSYDYSPQLEVPHCLLYSSLPLPPLPRLLPPSPVPAGAEGLPSLQLRLPSLQETPGSNCRHHWAGAVLGLPGVYCHTCTFPPVM